jgi:phosphopantothenoylcysteine decarboxylase/phosphopantothenate--cysteine ligase
MSELDQPLKGFRVLVCVTASISAYKSVYLVRSLTKLGAFVSVAITPSAQRFVGSATFSALASEAAFDDLWDNRGSIAHTTLGKSSDLIIVYPATASTIAKMASGIADDIVSSVLLCTPKETPVFVAPAMHEEMYDNPSTQENIQKLITRGVKFIGPLQGELAGGDVGKGRLVEPQSVVDNIVAVLKGTRPKNLDVKINSIATKSLSSNYEDKRPTMLITAGGTREPIDTVRVISNRSSGKMGHALADAANICGYKVILITASDLPCNEGVERHQVETSDEMYDAVMSIINRADVVVMAAAVSDFKPQQTLTQKLKRKDETTSISLVPAVDILEAVVAKKNAGTYVACFAAESENVLENASQKFDSKNVDMLIANDISRLDSKFGSDSNKIWIYDKSNQDPKEFDLLPKQALAFEIIDMIENNRSTTN